MVSVLKEAVASHRKATNFIAFVNSAQIEDTSKTTKITA
jgi:hypothetical protein